jgi:asparagine synthase (glutamine-hydrolysing)
MSIFIGRFNQAKIPLENNGLALMYGAVNHLPHEKYSEIVEGHLAFGHLLTYNTPESVYEVQPQMQDHIIFVSVGRIDNREYLSQKLGIELSETLSDGKIMQLAFQQFGLACVDLFRGDWAFAAFNYETEEMHLARCPMGYMSLYYTQIGEEFFFSNAIKPLIKVRGKDLKINEAKFLTNYALLGSLHKKNDYSTIFQEIYSVSMGSTLTLSNHSKNIRNYWQPENIKENSTKTTDEINQTMQTLFAQATERRLRSYKPVASMLSGGLDSSTVSFTAAEIMKEQGQKLTTLSHVPLFKSELEKDQILPFNKKRQLDESPLIMAIAKASGNITPQLLNSEYLGVIEGMETLLEVFDCPVHAAVNAYWMIDIFKNASGQGYGTLLSGEGGNGSISFSAINHFLPITLNRIKKFPKKTFKILIAKKIIYKYFYNQYKKIKGNEMLKYSFKTHLRTDFLQQNKETQSRETKNEDFEKNYLHIKELKAVFVEMYQMRSELGSLAGQYFGIELRDPTSDQDLMEFFFSIPNAYFFDGGFEGRMLVKRMMHEKLPSDVLYATKKGLQSADVVYRIQRETHSIEQRFEQLKNHSLVNYFFDLDKKTPITENDVHLNQAMILKTMHFADFLTKYF